MLTTEPPLTLLDACATVSLYATRRMEQILAAVDGSVAVVDVVAREAQYVLRGGDGEDAKERVPIDLRPLVARGTLSILATSDEEELLTFLDLTLEVDEGEAMTAALAMHCGCVVVTDDRKALRLLASRSVPQRTTLDLVKVWADRENLPSMALRAVLTDIRQRGNYSPHRRHPLRPWWEDAMSRG